MSKELSIKKLETIAVDALEDIKGRDIIIVNTTLDIFQCINGDGFKLFDREFFRHAVP